MLILDRQHLIITEDKNIELRKRTFKEFYNIY